MLVRNDKKKFFKYLSSSSAKYVLRDGTLKWSNPSLFNDPFDNDLDIILHEDEQLMTDQNLNYFMGALNNEHTIENLQNPLLFAQIEFLKSIIRKSGHVFTTKELDYIREGASVGVHNVRAHIPETNLAVKNLLKDISILCVSETHRNLLMWAHYSENHTGVVVQMASPESESFLRAAQRVSYVKKVPRFTIEDLVGANAPWNAISRLTLTKSTHWKYEREWRVVSTARDKTKSWEAIPFYEHELSAVYLGCRMKPDDREEVIALTRSKYPVTKIYQAKKHLTDFSLTFDLL